MEIEIDLLLELNFVFSKLNFIDLKKDIKQIAFFEQSNSVFSTKYFETSIDEYCFIYKIEKKIRYSIFGVSYWFSLFFKKIYYLLRFRNLVKLKKNFFSVEKILLILKKLEYYCF